MKMRKEKIKNNCNNVCVHTERKTNSFSLSLAPLPPTSPYKMPGPQTFFLLQYMHVYARDYFVNEARVFVRPYRSPSSASIDNTRVLQCSTRPCPARIMSLVLCPAHDPETLPPELSTPPWPSSRP